MSIVWVNRGYKGGEYKKQGGEIRLPLWGVGETRRSPPPTFIPGNF